MNNEPQETLASGRPRRRAANVHPGRIVLENQPKKPTSAQKEVNGDRAREALAVKVAAMKKGYQRIGSIEDKMELDQSSALSGSRPIKPRAHPRPGGVPENPSQVNDNGTYDAPWLTWKTMLVELLR